jgi:lipopolysaccharide/colanic/teichoic acid biosynthesis glycosyltransferase
MKRRSQLGKRTQPQLTEYLPHYTADQIRRYSVSAGNHGMAQISGRNLAVFSERLKLDIWYVDHSSMIAHAAPTLTERRSLNTFTPPL